MRCVVHKEVDVLIHKELAADWISCSLQVEGNRNV